MNAIIWKEFRENAKWAALGLIGMMVGTVFILVEGYYYKSWRPDASMGEFFPYIVFASCGIAPVIGLLQTALESRRDQWAYFMHRGISATKIFLAKVIVGLGVYAIIMLVPLLVVSICYEWWSPEHYLFDWRSMIPLLVTLLASVGLYFGGMLIAIRQSRIYVSRLLPVVLPGCLVFAVLVYAWEFDEVIPLWLVTVIAGFVVATGLAAWGIFIRSGESVALPMPAKIGLGINLTVAWLVGIASLVSLGAWFTDEVLDWQPSQTEVLYTYRVMPDGHILRIEHDALNRSNAWSSHILAVTDLDDPNSQKYTGHVGRLLINSGKPQEPVPRSAEEQELPTTDLWHGRHDPFSAGRNRLVEHMGAIVDRFEWVFSLTENLLYGYGIDGVDPETGRRRPPELMWIVGPDGFFTPDNFFTPKAAPPRRFPRPVSVAASNLSGNPLFVLRDRRVLDQAVRSKQYLVFEDSICEINFLERTVRTVYEAPEGEQIHSLTLLHDDQLAIVFDDFIEIHHSNPVAVGYITHVATGDSDDAIVPLPGEFVAKIPIPEAVQAFDHADFGILPGQDAVFFIWAGKFVSMKTDGEIIQMRDLPASAPLGVIRNSTTPMCAIAACYPLAAVIVSIGADAILDASNGTSLRAAGFWNDPLGLVPPAIVVVGLSFISLFFAWRTARRYGFTRRERSWWFAISFLLGPAGLLALYCLRSRSVRLPCTVCGEPRPVDVISCPVCQSAFEPLPEDGTEILALST